MGGRDQSERQEAPRDELRRRNRLEAIVIVAIFVVGLVVAMPIALVLNNKNKSSSSSSSNIPSLSPNPPSVTRNPTTLSPSQPTVTRHTATLQFQLSGLTEPLQSTEEGTLFFEASCRGFFEDQLATVENVECKVLDASERRLQQATTFNDALQSILVAVSGTSSAPVDSFTDQVKQIVESSPSELVNTLQRSEFFATLLDIHGFVVLDNAIVVMPDWYEIVKDYDVLYANIQPCLELQSDPPSTGDTCGSEIKTCFFETQRCNDGLELPSNSCVCIDNKWECQVFACPNDTSRCPNIENGPECDDPTVFPDGVDEITCLNGTPEECCGECSLASAGYCIYYRLSNETEIGGECSSGTYQCPESCTSKLPEVLSTPYEGIKTTPMDPYVREDCYYGDNLFPHVISQCECFQSISMVANDTMNLYQQVRQDISEVFYNGEYSEPVTSCHPANQALIWLSSGDTRDAGDIYQRFATAMIYIQMNGTSWDQNNLWLSDDSECTWYGLQCNGRFQLNNFALDTNNVHGSIPTEISKIESLKTVSLSRNHLSGSIPKEIITMPHLENLFLYTNQLIGNIPTEIGLATNLKALRLENNLFFGTIAKEIGQATNLEELSIGFNEFWRRIPTEMGLLTNMKWLVMEENRLSGTLPTEFGQMSKLEYFLLSKNLMVGELPTEMAQMTNLQEFRLAETGLGGVFPHQFQQLHKLNRLEMGYNNFEGTIMSEFGNMIALSWLSMNNNYIKGTLPTELGNLVNMAHMSFKDCQLTGTIPSEFGQMTMLVNLSLENNMLSGSAPNEVCMLRSLELYSFVTDCPSGQGGVECPIPACCTLCRRQEQTVFDSVALPNP